MMERMTYEHPTLQQTGRSLIPRAHLLHTNDVQVALMGGHDPIQNPPFKPIVQ